IKTFVVSILSRKYGFLIEAPVSKSTFLWKKSSNFSHNEISFSQRSIGSITSISTRRSISLLSGSKRFVTDEPKAYSDFTLWEAHKFSNSLIRFDISSINSMYQIYQILYVKPSSELLFSLHWLKPGATIPGRAYRRCVCTALAVKS